MPRTFQNDEICLSRGVASFALVLSAVVLGAAGGHVRSQVMLLFFVFDHVDYTTATRPHCSRTRATRTTRLAGGRRWALAVLWGIR